MHDPGTKIVMTKGYKGAKGTIHRKTASPYELYTILLDNGIHLVAGPSAFIPHPEKKDPNGG